MCLINSNITETENKEVKRNSDITINGNNKFPFYYAHNSLKISLALL